jgi:glycosyltransferase involved in cell wall biosynthesis
MNKIPISVIVSVKNEEINLPNCLDKLKNFSQVVIVDSMSTDKTPEIVKSYGYQLVNFKWNGKFPKKRNWTIKNVQLNNEWLLFLDADEIITLNFVDEITYKIKETTHVGFWLNFNNYFMGKKLNYGDKMRKLAFFKKGSGEYEKIEEDTWSHLDMEIHEHPILDGTVGEINSPIEHNDYKGLEHYIAKHNAYSSWEANRFFSIKNNKKHLTKRQRFKYKMLSSGFLPLIYFVYSFIIKVGFLDGKSGLYLAKYKANYFFQIQTKIKELKKNN